MRQTETYNFLPTFVSSSISPSRTEYAKVMHAALAVHVLIVCTFRFTSGLIKIVKNTRNMPKYEQQDGKSCKKKSREITYIINYYYYNIISDCSACISCA